MSIINNSNNDYVCTIQSNKSMNEYDILARCSKTPYTCVYTYIIWRSLNLTEGNVKTHSTLLKREIVALELLKACSSGYNFYRLNGS